MLDHVEHLLALLRPHRVTQDAAEQARDAFRKGAEQFEKLSIDTTVPESVRALAEKTVTQTREAYEKGKDALEEAVDALERSFDAAGQGATAFNRKLIERMRAG